jgi:hypothetical protein
MNFKKIFFTTLITSILLSIFSRNNIASSELTNKQTINYHKLSTVKNTIIHSQDFTHTLIGGRIITQFSFKDSQGEKINLNQLAKKLGYDHFNWVNYVEKDPHGIKDWQGRIMSTPYNDPPMGGYQYDRADRLPFYWDVAICDRCNPRHHFQNHNNWQQFGLIFEDAPVDHRLQPGEAIEFKTSLVGVKEINLAQHQAEWEILHTFSWKLTNPRTDYSRVSVVDTDVDPSQLSPTLRQTMLLDGAKLPTPQKAAQVSNHDPTKKRSPLALP